MQPELYESDFDSQVKQTTGKVLVEFFATWCPHCKRQQPVTDEAAAELKGEVPVFQVDIDKAPALAQEYAPNGVPTYVLFDAGRPVASHAGEWPLSDLLQMVEAN